MKASDVWQVEFNVDLLVTYLFFWQKHLGCDFSYSYYEPKITTPESTFGGGKVQHKHLQSEQHGKSELTCPITTLVIQKRHSENLTLCFHIFHNSGKKTCKYYLYKLWGRERELMDGVRCFLPVSRDSQYLHTWRPCFVRIFSGGHYTRIEILSSSASVKLASSISSPYSICFYNV